MISFLNPQALYYLLPPLFILFGFLLTKKESKSHFFSDEVMDKLKVGANSLTLKARNSIFLMMGFFIVLALGEPVIDDGVIEVKAKSADIMIALDISDSMLAQDRYPNRLEFAKHKAVTLLNYAPDERVGIMAFAKNSYLVSPLSFDTKAVSFLLTQLDTTSITEKGTDFLSIINIFASSSDNDGEKYLLVLTDGGDKDDFSKEIELAKEENIVVFVLGVGSEKGAPIKLKDGSFIEQNGKIIVSKLNENISKLATSTGGVYIESSTSTKDMKTMLKEIKSIAKSKELKSEEINKYIPLFQYPVGLAILFLLIAISSVGRSESLHLAKGFIVVALLSLQVESEAGMLDFMDLRDAKSAYEVGEYAKSAKLYEEYAKSSHSPQSYFNAGNAFYKDKKYKKAQESYEKATFSDDELRARNLSNIGNSLAKQKELKKAVESYEKSLKIKEDKDTRDNLQTVKELIKEQEKQEDKKQDKESKDKKDDEKKSDDEKDGDKSEDADKDSKQKDSNKKEEDSSKSKDSKDKKQDDKDMKSKEEKEDDSKDKNSDDINKTKKQEKKEQLKKLNENENNESCDNPSPVDAMPTDEMSDAEEQKWLNQLNQEKNTYMYMLGKEQPMKENNDEKPW